MTRENPTIFYLTGPISAYDFTVQPLAFADIVIDNTGRIAKHRHGVAGRQAPRELIDKAQEIGPNRE